MMQWKIYRIVCWSN